MTQTNKFTPNAEERSKLTLRMLVGAAIGLILISLFVLPITGKPEWGAYWKIRPLLVVPFAGAMGGLVFHAMGFLRAKGGWKALLANVASVLIFIIGLWLGTVLGLDGTLWN